MVDIWHCILAEFKLEATTGFDIIHASLSHVFSLTREEVLLLLLAIGIHPSDGSLGRVA